jgi:divalent metal cation (Fe/Co/Zn/Cd) transporter
VRRGVLLNRLSLAYNVVEAGATLAAGLAAGSVALVGFGVDSVIEVSATVAAAWRLHADDDEARRARVERLALRGIGVSFLALAAFVAWESVESLVLREAPSPSRVGLAILLLSALVMPVLARAKREVARALSSDALVAEAAQTALCAWLSWIALAGVAANALLGWWWADPVAALAMVPIIAREGWTSVRGAPGCHGCGCQTGHVG